MPHATKEPYRSINRLILPHRRDGGSYSGRGVSRTDLPNARFARLRVPESIGGLTKLRQLWLSSSLRQLPPSMSLLRNLEELTFGHNSSRLKAMPDLSGNKNLSVRRLPPHLQAWAMSEFRQWPSNEAASSQGSIMDGRDEVAHSHGDDSFTFGSREDDTNLDSDGDEV